MLHTLFKIILAILSIIGICCVLAFIWLANAIIDDNEEDDDYEE